MPKCLKYYADSEKARAYRNRQRKRNYDKCPGDPRVSKSPWTDDEVKLVLDHTMTDREISKKIGRSVTAIQMKRCKTLKRMKGIDNDRT